MLLPDLADLCGLGVAAAISLVAAITDLRSTRIPNWLTLPPLVAPLVYLAIYGPMAALSSAIGIFVCSFVFYIIFRYGGGGGGDVKHLAAMGALVGVQRGVEILIATVFAAGIYAIVRLLWERRMLQTLRNVLFLLVNPVLPKDKRQPIRREQMSNIRMGPAFFAGCIAVLLWSRTELFQALGLSF
ncbi:MAG: A24 family peptidase [Myxococcota bacterium]